jgi:WD40 repeat protein
MHWDDCLGRRALLCSGTLAAAEIGLGLKSIALGSETGWPARAIASRATVMRWDRGSGNVLVGYEGTLQVLDGESGRMLRSIAVGMEKVFDLALDSQGSKLLVAGGDPGQRGIVELRAWPSGELIRVDATDGDVVTRAQWSPRDDRWLEADWSGACRLRAADHAGSLRLDGHARPVLATAWSASHNWIATAGMEPAIQVRDSESGSLIRTLDQHTRTVVALVFVRPEQASEDYLISAGEDGTVRLWQPRIGRLVRFVRLPARPLCAEWMGSGFVLAVALDDGRVVEVDLKDLSIHHWVGGDSDRVHAMAISRESHELYLVKGSNFSRHARTIRNESVDSNIRGRSSDE